MGDVGGVMKVPSAWARWRGWGSCPIFLSKQWIVQHVDVYFCVAAREGLDDVLREPYCLPRDFERDRWDKGVLVL